MSLRNTYTTTTKTKMKTRNCLKIRNRCYYVTLSPRYIRKRDNEMLTLTLNRWSCPRDGSFGQNVSISEKCLLTNTATFSRLSKTIFFIPSTISSVVDVLGRPDSHSRPPLKVLCNFFVQSKLTKLLLFLKNAILQTKIVNQRFYIIHNTQSTIFLSNYIIYNQLNLNLNNHFAQMKRAKTNNRSNYMPLDLL